MDQCVCRPRDLSLRPIRIVMDAAAETLTSQIHFINSIFNENMTLARFCCDRHQRMFTDLSNNFDLFQHHIDLYPDYLQTTIIDFYMAQMNSLYDKIIIHLSDSELNLDV